MDEAIIKELKEKMDAGAEAATIEDIPKVWDFFTKVAEESEDLKEELEDMDIKVQMVISDKDAKYWLVASDGKLEWGEGETDDPSFTFTCNMATGAGMLFGEVDATSAYMAGDITVEGNLQDAMAFQEIIELAMEAFEDLLDEL